MSVQVSRPQRPQLSLQTKHISNPNSRSSYPIAFLDSKDLTALNTLSNAYVDVIDSVAVRVQSPYSTTTPDSPFTTPRFPASASTSMKCVAPNSAKSSPSSRCLSLPPTLAAGANSCTRRSPSPRAAPYTHPRSLRSILRNSPLTLRNAQTTSPQSPIPSRASVTSSLPISASSSQSGNRSPKRVRYEAPLTQVITTNKYIRSHIELLAEDSNSLPISPISSSDSDLSTSSKFCATPDKMNVQLSSCTPSPTPAVQITAVATPSDLNKRIPRSEKTRRWVWTIGLDEETEDGL